MKDLLKEIQKSLPPCGTPRRMKDPGMFGSPTTTLYGVICEVELVPTSQAIAGPNQAVGASRQQESGRVPERAKDSISGKGPVASDLKKSTERSARFGWVQSPMPEKGRTPERAKTSDRRNYCTGFATASTRLHDCGVVGIPTFSCTDDSGAKDHSDPVWPEQGKDGGGRSFTTAKRPKEEGAGPGAFRLGRRIMGTDRAFSS